MRPDQASVGYARDAADQRKRIFHVVKHATGEHEVEARGAVPQIEIEIAEQEFSALHGERFLHNQAFQISLDIRLDRENTCGAKLFELMAVCALERTELQHSHSV